MITCRIAEGCYSHRPRRSALPLSSFAMGVMDGHDCGGRVGLNGSKSGAIHRLWRTIEGRAC